jgi:Glycoside hydrolase family 44/Secretion system C-terminal sorting domain
MGDFGSQSGLIKKFIISGILLVTIPAPPNAPVGSYPYNPLPISMRKILLVSLVLCLRQRLDAQNVQVSVNILNNSKAVSPSIYGRNNSLSDDPGNPVSGTNWQLYKEAGVHFFRENGGNNLSKYNWRLKLSSHPDWYNNVYPSDWDYSALSLHQNIPAAQGMWGFQLIGQSALTNTNNFNDFGFNGSQWWTGVEQNLAGGGVVNTAGGSQALVNGDTTLYLEHWPADSTAGLLTHWFGGGGLGLDSTKIRYWNMDNEVEIWSSTHDDVMPVQPSAEAFMQLYFTVAKKARALFPGIKLTGPVSPNEWQWYNWNNTTVTGTDGKQYPWLEFFIKRVSEEEQRTGIRLLDVIDLHFYPGSSTASDVVQYHRVFFDSTYNFPEANGVKVVNGAWDNSIQIEDIFGRCQNWLNQYMGAGNGVTFAVSETATQLQNDPNSLAVWYASMMGEFMNHGVEYFSPWTWGVGMWETLHLFSRYNKTNSVQAVSSDELDVSAYATTDNAHDSVTVALVNRSLTETKTVTLSFPNFLVSGQPVTSLTLSNLPAGTETFVSNTNNALHTASVLPLVDNTLQVTMAPLSITSLLIAGASTILPVTLLSFTASKSDPGVLLRFATTNELNLSSFDIERSPDGGVFTKIGTVPAAQSANNAADAATERDYTFNDHQPLPSLNYYRLKMIDQDGGYTYSKTITIRYDNNSFVTIFPNPAKDALNVQLLMPAGPILLQVIDASGQPVRAMSLQSSGATLSVTLDIAGLARGLYYIRAGGDVLSFVKR